MKIVLEDPNAHLTQDLVTPDCKGKIIVGGSLVTKECLHKAVEVGVAGIVTGGIKDIDLESFLGYELGVAITGQEDVGITLVVTEGFGEMAMNPRTLELFQQFSGFKASINGATQIRAGVVRPEIIIPHEKESLKEDNFSRGMMPGTSVRLIRSPYFGALGKVLNLPVELQFLESESKVRVVEVELIDGRRVKVPRANVELIET